MRIQPLLTAVLVSMSMSACATDSISTTAEPTRIPAGEIVRDICRGGCPDDVLQELEKPNWIWDRVVDERVGDNSGTATDYGRTGTELTLSQLGIAMTYVGQETASQYDNDGEICSLLPATGVCADACDPVAVLQHVRPSTCTLFRCELTDGRVVLTGGCR